MENFTGHTGNFVRKSSKAVFQIGTRSGKLFSAMNKRAIIKKIVARLADELETYFRAAQFSRAEATHESSKAEMDRFLLKSTALQESVGP